MQLFITGTDTNVGKTIISSWLCLHTGYSYFKPIQAGGCDGTDSETVAKLANCKIYKEAYSFQLPASPHIAAAAEQRTIDLARITIPPAENLIIEGAGGLMVPLNDNQTMLDFIKMHELPVILVVNPRLGAINHSLLSIEALRSRNIKILGIIFSGDIYPGSYDIARFGKVEILGELPMLKDVTSNELLNIPLPQKLARILKGSE